MHYIFLHLYFTFTFILFCLMAIEPVAGLVTRRDDYDMSNTTYLASPWNSRVGDMIGCTRPFPPWSLVVTCTRMTDKDKKVHFQHVFFSLLTAPSQDKGTWQPWPARFRVASNSRASHQPDGVHAVHRPAPRLACHHLMQKNCDSERCSPCSHCVVGELMCGLLHIKYSSLYCFIVSAVQWVSITAMEVCVNWWSRDEGAPADDLMSRGNQPMTWWLTSRWHFPAYYTHIIA